MLSKGAVSYGGQAVIEGVMMRGPREMAVAVRRTSGEIVVEKRELRPWGERVKVGRWPVIRGAIALAESLALGFSTLAFSAEAAFEDEGEELGGWAWWLAVVLALVLGVAMFAVLPAAISRWMLPGGASFGRNMIESVTRLAVFILYITGISFIPDLRRVLQYHGAEHKAINALERWGRLKLEEVRLEPRFHPRCGTSLLFLMVVVAILVYGLFPADSWGSHVLSRILGLPLIAGIGYELLRLTGQRRTGRFWRVVALPGIWAQYLTTREPGDGELEVAIRALEEICPEKEVGERV